MCSIVIIKEMHVKVKDSVMIAYMKISVFILTKLNFIQCTKRYIFVAYETYTLTLKTVMWLRE